MRYNEELYDKFLEVFLEISSISETRLGNQKQL